MTPRSSAAKCSVALCVAALPFAGCTHSSYERAALRLREVPIGVTLSQLSDELGGATWDRFDASSKLDPFYTVYGKLKSGEDLRVSATCGSTNCDPVRSPHLARYIGWYCIGEANGARTSERWAYADGLVIDEPATP